MGSMTSRRWAVLIAATLAVPGCAYLSPEYSKIGYEGGGEDAKFIAAEEKGAKIWQGSDTVNLANRTKPVVLKVVNSLNAEHGFSIDSMKVHEVLMPNEEKTIVVPVENIDLTVADHRVYCQLHPKHVAAVFPVAR